MIEFSSKKVLKAINKENGNSLFAWALQCFSIFISRSTFRNSEKLFINEKKSTVSPGISTFL